MIFSYSKNMTKNNKYWNLKKIKLKRVIMRNPQTGWPDFQEPLSLDKYRYREDKQRSERRLTSEWLIKKKKDI